MTYVTEKKNEKNGVIYNIIETNEIFETTCSVDDKRIVISGKVALEEMTNSWKFGKQIQVVVFGYLKSVEQRANNRGYARVEIAIPFKVGKELILQMAKKLENIED